MNKPLCRSALALLLLAGAAGLRANDRHFVYTYETSVLPPMVKEFEVTSTWRQNRGDLYYGELDQRAELEWGVTDNLQTSVYLNWSGTREETAPGVRGHRYEFQGVSSEWKYKLRDPVADKVGFALYEELSAGPKEFESETRIILDKRLGDHLLAFNLVLEPEWEWKKSFKDYELNLETDFGWAYLINSRWSAGLEARAHSVYTRENGDEYVALFAGPAIHYSGKNWWMTLTAMPQLPALKRNADTPDSNYILNDHERFNARLIFSFSF